MMKPSKLEEDIFENSKLMNELTDDEFIEFIFTYKQQFLEYVQYNYFFKRDFQNRLNSKNIDIIIEKFIELLVYV